MPASNNIKELLATAEIDFGADAFQIILMELGFVFDPDTHDEYADVAGNELPTLNGYTIGGETLAGVAVTRNDLDDRIDVTWNNVTWTAVGGPIGPAVGAIIYDDTVLNDPDRKSVV